VLEVSCVRFTPLAVFCCAIACGSSQSAAPPDGGAENTPDNDASTSDGASPDAGSAQKSCTTYAAGALPLRDGKVLALSKVYLDRDRGGARNPNAWKSYGFDLDGEATDGTSTNHCQPAPGADAARVKTDGDEGIDNGFGASILPIISSFDKPNDPTWVDKWNSSLATRSGFVARFMPTATSYAAQLLSDTPLCSGGPVLSPRLVPIDVASLQNRDIDHPNTVIDGKLEEDVWTSGRIDKITLLIPLKGGTIPIQVHDVRIKMTLAADGSTATGGVLGGIANTEDLITQLRTNKGYITSLACVPGVFESYETKIRQASDILDDGTQDPSKVCNGISLGLGFDLARVAIGSVEEAPITADPCAK
jgi:hypothetical protein